MEYASVRGEAVPAIGLGTYRLRGSECRETVQTALEIGYRHIDTAEFYENQAEIGAAIDAATVPREALFVTTKVWKTNLEAEAVHRSFTNSLEALDLEYVDLLLIHWPNENVPVEQTLEAMNHLQAEGLVRHVGVSNFSVTQLEEAIAASRTPILTNQVEYNPYVDRDALLEYCRDQDVLLTAYSPLVKGKVLEDDTLEEIGDRYGKSPAQVALRWLVQQDGVIAIPKASSREHLEANLDVFDFTVTDQEMAQIDSLRRGLVSRARDALGL
ncbi:aldo/keto reductase [Halobacteria archaeon AArc-curdl1]|uniref:Aldo/keto reductase n=1 Tax=Natronosalvus hydrolyticus TaxID=2979988 RepID=A0AAP2ZAH7_9EURY|nr:aldo/keto reductase [Halobacteria archaeon AArc-curdl1]